MALRKHPGIFLVRPNIGQPLILLQGQVSQEYQLTFAGKTDWFPTYSEVKTWIKSDTLYLVSQATKDVRDSKLQIRKVTLPRKIPQLLNIPLVGQLHPKMPTDYQSKAGFQWEFDVTVLISPSPPVQQAPQIFALRYTRKSWESEFGRWRETETLNQHSVYVDERFSTRDFIRNDYSSHRTPRRLPQRSYT
jgi:hypothetical protein